MTTSLRKNFLKEIMINNQLIVMNEKLIKQTEGLSVFAEKNKQFVAMLAEI